MAAEGLSPVPKLKFFDNAGNPLNGGKLFTYAAGTITKIATYVDSTGGTPNTNPIILDYRGECNCWIPPNVAFKYVLAPATDTDPPTNPIFSVDQVVNSQLITLYGGVDTGSANAYVLNFVANFTSYTDGIIIYWIPANTNTGASTINVNGLGAVSIINQDGSILRPGQLIASNVVGILYKGGNFILLNVNAVGLTPSINTKNTNYQFVIGDAYNIVLHNDASSYNYTIPADATVNFALGTSIQIINQSSNSLILVPAGGVSLYPFGSASLVSASIALAPVTATYIIKTAANTWMQSNITSISVYNGGFGGVLTGMSAGGTGAVVCARAGAFAVVAINGAITGTSNTTAMTLGTIPTEYRPSNTRVVSSVGMQDNALQVGGVASISAAGVITFGTGINNNAAGFTAAGFKGLQAGWSVIYPL